MSAPILTLLLAAMVILIAGASYRRRAGSQAPASPRLMTALAVGLALLALVLASLLYWRRHVG